MAPKPSNDSTGPDEAALWMQEHSKEQLRALVIELSQRGVDVHEIAEALEDLESIEVEERLWEADHPDSLASKTS